MRLTTFRTSNKICENPAFPPVVQRLRVPTKQQHIRPHSVLDWACQTLWPIQLDDGEMAVQLPWSCKQLLVQPSPHCGFSLMQGVHMLDPLRPLCPSRAAYHIREGSCQIHHVFDPRVWRWLGWRPMRLVSRAWEAAVLPLNYTRARVDSTRVCGCPAIARGERGRRSPLHCQPFLTAASVAVIYSR